MSPENQAPPSNQQNPWEANDPTNLQRPEPNPPVASSKVLWWGALLSLIGFLAHALSIYAGLPETIPTHFNLSGEPDGWGSKSTFIMMIVIGLLCSGSCLLLSRYPRIFNVPKAPARDEGWQKIYTASRNLMSVLSISCSALFATITLSTQAVADGRQTSSLLTFVVLGVMLAHMAYSIYTMLKIAREN